MSYSAFSSEVELRLVVGDHILELSHTNPENVILRNPAAEFPPTKAEIVTTIDGIEHRRPVQLPEGISLDNDRVSFRPIDDPSAP